MNDNKKIIIRFGVVLTFMLILISGVAIILGQENLLFLVFIPIIVAIYSYAGYAIHKEVNLDEFEFLSFGCRYNFKLWKLVVKTMCYPGYLLVDSITQLYELIKKRQKAKAHTLLPPPAAQSDA